MWSHEIFMQLIWCVTDKCEICFLKSALTKTTGKKTQDHQLITLGKEPKNHVELWRESIHSTLRSLFFGLVKNGWEIWKVQGGLATSLEKSFFLCQEAKSIWPMHNGLRHILKIVLKWTKNALDILSGLVKFNGILRFFKFCPDFSSFVQICQF